MSYIPHCTHCKTVKDLMPSPYMKNRDKDGNVTSVGYLCRKCNTERMKRYRHTDNGSRRTREASKRSTIKHGLKQAARVKLNQALRSGKIEKPGECASCSNSKIVEGHHKDYSKPLAVLWVCRQCHADLHRA